MTSSSDTKTSNSRWPFLDIAVLLPCYNEETTIASVIESFQTKLPEANIYVYDNDSTDKTAVNAELAGAVVRHEEKRGKGNVVRRMFVDIEADIYILSDGDMTYDISDIEVFIEKMLQERTDVLVGERHSEKGDSFPLYHVFGNKFFNKAASLLFGSTFQDIFSGFRVLSRRFVKSFPAVSRGFEIELELAVHATNLRIPVSEIPVTYHPRPVGSHSKLSTIPDGLRILRTLILLFVEIRPFLFFSIWAAIFSLASIVLGYPLVINFWETGLVPRLPTAILATGMMLIGFMALSCALILDNVSKGRHESKRLWYLSYGPVTSGDLKKKDNNAV